MNQSLLTLFRALSVASALTFGGSPQAEEPPPVSAEHAWARATVAGQASSGAFMTLRSPRAVQVVGAHTPVAALAQVHEMVEEGGRMSMRPVPSLSLPAGTPVELKPNGMHVMLLDLKQPLVAGQHFPLTLELAGADGQKREATIDVEVRPLGAAHP